MDTNKKEIIDALQKYNGIVTNACASIGLSRSTYYSWLNSDDEFKAAVDDIQDVAIDFVESKLMEKINGVSTVTYTAKGEELVYEQPPSDTAIIFFLKTKGKKRGYVERSEIDHTTKGQAIGAKDLSKLTDEELRQMALIEGKLNA